MFILFIIAGILLALGIYLLITRIRFMKNGVLTEATVIDRYIGDAIMSDDDKSLFVTFQYHSPENETLTFKKEIGVSEAWQIGAKEMIIYQKNDPTYNDPETVIFFDYGPAFLDVIIVFSATVILTVIAAGYYWAEHFFNSLL
jgi:uncharacterized protein DUF3592